MLMSLVPFDVMEDFPKLNRVTIYDWMTSSTFVLRILCIENNMPKF